MKKRIIQLALAICMLLTLLPTKAEAAEPYFSVSNKNGYSCSVRVQNPPASYRMYFASYDEGGRLLKVWQSPKNLPLVTLVAAEGSAYAKVCLVEADSYKPLCPAKKISFLPVRVAVNFYDGDSLIDTKTVTYEETYGELPTPTKASYEFLGWFTAPTGGQKVTANSKVTSENPISLYALWRKTGFLLHFYDGSTLVDTKAVSSGQAYGKLPDPPEKENAVFLGWYTAAEGGQQVTADTKLTANRDVTLYAHWRRENITVNFYDGNNLIESRTVPYGGAYGKLPVLENHESRTFLGWFTAAEGGQQVTAETKVSTETDISLYAQWKGAKQIPATIFDFGNPEVFSFTYGNDYGPKPRSATFQYTREEGETYTKSQFEIKYKRQGSTEYEPGNPGTVGTYDVTITRPADDTYNAFEHTYEGVLVINKGVHNAAVPFVKIMVEDRGYTWFEFELAKSGQWDYTGYTEDEATVTYYVSPDKVKVYQSEPGSNRVRLPEHLGCDYNVRVEIKNDPNWEDWSSPWMTQYYLNYTDFTISKYNLLPYPTQTWQQAGMYDTSWYSAERTEFTVTTPEELAGLAYLVNNNGQTFAGKTVKLGNDISLIGYAWDPIGNGSTQFKGTFDGQNHSILDLYLSGGVTYAGLFGYTNGSSSDYAEIKNLTLEESKVAGSHQANHAGGIVGLAKYTRLMNCVSYTGVTCNKESSPVGGIAGTAEHAEIIDCINYGNLAGMGNVGGIVGKATSATNIITCINRGVVTSAMNVCGGIVGRVAGNTHIANCINDGEVSTGNNSEDFGGIAGLVEAGQVYNCANHGYVKGYRCVGGIVGRNQADGKIYNCYNGITGDYLHVYGTARSEFYVGAVVGRNEKNKGTVDACYYLLSSAKNYNGFVDGAGTKTGSTNSVDNLDIGYYHGWTSNVEGYWYGYNGGSSATKAPLIDILNRWQADHVYAGYILANYWVGTDDGYPLPNLTIW